jgi:hypothetical protein
VSLISSTAGLRNAVRRLSSGNSYVHRAVNRLFGSGRETGYIKLLSLSEAEDPVADITGIREIRSKMARDHIEQRFPDRVQSAARIYGIKEALFGDQAARLDTPAIEHGLFLGSHISRADTLYSGAATYASFSSFRREQIQKYRNVPVFAVGPYLSYARPFYGSQRQAEEKRSLGRTLLVYPAHSTHDSRLDSDAERFQWLKRAARGFDSVLVNVYWWDINELYVDHLEAQGYRIVCAGLMHDRNFLARQRTILRLADHVVSDGIGTHIGYAVSEGRPFSLVSNIHEAKTTERRPPNERLNRSQVASHAAINTELADAFTNAETIGTRQHDIVNYYWGLDQRKSQDELEAIRSITADLIRQTGGFAALVPTAARRLLCTYEETDPLKLRLLADASPFTGARRTKRTDGSPV